MTEPVKPDAPAPDADPKPQDTPPAPDPKPDEPKADPKPDDSPAPDPKPDDEPFDKDRALATIRTQREAEKKLKKERDDALAKVKEHEDADLSEQERNKKQAAEAQAKAEALEGQLRETRITVALTSKAAELKFRAPALAPQLVDKSKVEFDDDGNVTNAEELLTGLLTEHPFLKEGSGDARPTDLKQVLKDGEPVIEDGKPIEGEAARNLLKADPDKFNELFDKGLIKGV